MRIIGREKIQQAIAKHRNWESSLSAWSTTVEEAAWRHFVDVRHTYKSADNVGDCVVFNIKHNDCRLIAFIGYKFQTIHVLHVLTHAEYAKERWKSDCNCK